MQWPYILQGVLFAHRTAQHSSSVITHHHEICINIILITYYNMRACVSGLCDDMYHKYDNSLFFCDIQIFNILFTSHC